MAMMQPAIVSTECPSCGAPLDFGEGTNAVTCQHCNSQLLVTGRTQLLSYAIAPTVDAREAARAAAYACQAAGRPARVRDATLWLIPYYRMTGHDLRWEWARTQREARDATDPTEARLWARVLPHGMAVGVPDLDDDVRQLQLHDRYIEKSFLACDSEGLGVPLSLGLRPAVLRLELFRPERGGTPVRVIAPTLGPERAWEIGLKAVGAGSAVYRQVLRRVLSLVYQPLWAVAVKAAGDAIVLVDASTGKTVTRLEPASGAGGPAADAPPAKAAIVGLRPLVCPNCGNGFPLQADEILAPCPSCWRTYAIHGHELRPVAYRLADPASANDGEGTTHLPFWVMDASLGAKRSRFHVPAFRYRRLKFLVDLARALVAKTPAYDDSPPNQFNGRGAVYDADDAAALASFVLSASDPRSDRIAKQLASTPLQVHSARLVWIPFRQQGDVLIDPFTARAFSQSLLSPPAPGLAELRLPA
jgi:DNA-directed RNA polymerase subunit RPC12/RpoP